MRINVYNEELTTDVKLIEKQAANGTMFYGLHFYLESSSLLHHKENDDDRSAVILWGDSPRRLITVLSKALKEAEKLNTLS